MVSTIHFSLNICRQISIFYIVYLSEVGSSPQCSLPAASVPEAQLSSLCSCTLQMCTDSPKGSRHIVGTSKMSIINSLLFDKFFATKAVESKSSTSIGTMILNIMIYFNNSGKVTSKGSHTIVF